MMNAAGLAFLYLLWLAIASAAFIVLSYFLNRHIQIKNANELLSTFQESVPDLMKQISYILSKNLYLTPHKCGDHSECINLIFDIYRSLDFDKKKESKRIKYYLKKAKKYFKFSVHKFQIMDSYNKVKRQIKNENNFSDYYAQKKNMLKMESQMIEQLVNAKLSCVANFSSWDLKIKKILKSEDQLFPQNCKYILDFISSVEAIIRLIMLSRYAKKIIDQDNELHKLISNAIVELQNTDLIVEKTYPIYQQFYDQSNSSKSKFDKNTKIIPNEVHYSIFVNYVKKLKNYNFKKNNGNTENILKPKFWKSKIRWFRDEILRLLEEKIKNNDDTTILNAKRIVNDILDKTLTLCEFNNVKDFRALIWVLTHLDELLKHYEVQIEMDTQTKLRKRYLNGDFNNERESIRQEFSLANIESGYHFEIFLENLFRRLGYKVHSTARTGDQGADLLIKKEKKTYVIQAKFYSSNLGNTPVQEVVGSLKFYNANQGVVITNTEFTKGARDLAKANNVILIDGHQLKSLVDHIFDSDIRDEDILALKFGER